MKEYKYEDLFSEDPNDPENLILTIPPEIMEAKGWTEGSRIKISVGDQGSLILEDIDEKETNE
jgi:hypothetical protein